MIVDALLAAEPVLKFARHIDNPEKFLYLTDNIMSEILSSDKPVSQYPYSFLPLVMIYLLRNWPSHEQYSIVSWSAICIDALITKSSTCHSNPFSVPTFNPSRSLRRLKLYTPHRVLCRHPRSAFSQFVRKANVVITPISSRSRI